MTKNEALIIMRNILLITPLQTALIEREDRQFHQRFE